MGKSEWSLKFKVIAKEILANLRKVSGISPVSIYEKVARSLNLGVVSEIITVSDVLVANGYIREQEVESQANGRLHSFWTITENGIELLNELLVLPDLVPQCFQIIIDKAPALLCFGQKEQERLAETLKGTLQAEILIIATEPFGKIGNFETLLKVVRALFGDKSKVLISLNNVVSDCEEPEDEVKKFFE